MGESLTVTSCPCSMGREAVSVRQCLVHVLQKVPDQCAVGLSSVTRGHGSRPGPASSHPATAWVAWKEVLVGQGCARGGSQPSTVAAIPVGQPCAVQGGRPMYAGWGAVWHAFLAGGVRPRPDAVGVGARHSYGYVVVIRG
eukprot:9500742-Pyramimonas_sp.AAC.1